MGSATLSQLTFIGRKSDPYNIPWATFHWDNEVHRTRLNQPPPQRKERKRKEKKKRKKKEKKKEKRKEKKKKRKSRDKTPV